MLGLVAPQMTVKNDGSCSRRPDTATRNIARAMPPSVCRSSGSSVRLPAKLTLASVMVLPLPVAWPGGLPCPWTRGDGRAPWHARLVEELVRKGRNVAIQVMLLTQRATGDAIPTRIRDNCQVAISFATRTVDGAVAALGEEIRQHPDASPVLLNDPAYVGVAVTSLPGRPGFHRVRTPQVDHHQVAAIIRATASLWADPAVVLADQAPGLRVVPAMPAPGDVA
jgi:hypothetical protein